MPIYDLRPHSTPIVAQIIKKLPNVKEEILDTIKVKTVPNNGHFLAIKKPESKELTIYEVLVVLHFPTTEGVASTESVDVRIYVKEKDLTSEVLELQDI